MPVAIAKAKGSASSWGKKATNFKSRYRIGESVLIRKLWAVTVLV